MGWYDYLTDLYASASITDVSAEVQDDMKHSSGEFNDGNDQTASGMGQAQQRGGAATTGGASTKSPVSGTNEESAAEAEVNKQDVKSGGEEAVGHKPGDGGEGSGQVGADSAGPHGGAVGKGGDDDEEEAAGGDEEEAGGDDEEEEEEEEEEPEDLKPRFEEECKKSSQCAPLKHHYDECAERVTHQHQQHGKAHEDCVEEYFHLMHCAAQCAAPKLFKALR